MTDIIQPLSNIYTDWLKESRRFDCLASRTQFLNWLADKVHNLPVCCEQCGQPEDIFEGPMVHNGTCEDCLYNENLECEAAEERAAEEAWRDEQYAKHAAAGEALYGRFLYEHDLDDGPYARSRFDQWVDDECASVEV
jgi:hypothetical protein